MPAAQLVDALEIGVTQEARAAGKGALAGSRRETSRLDIMLRDIMIRNIMLPNIMIRFSGHTGGRSDSEFQIAISRWLRQHG
jgi:hypothetical protein